MLSKIVLLQEELSLQSSRSLWWEIIVWVCMESILLIWEVGVAVDVDVGEGLADFFRLPKVAQKWMWESSTPTWPPGKPTFPNCQRTTTTNDNFQVWPGKQVELREGGADEGGAGSGLDFQHSPHHSSGQDHCHHPPHHSSGQEHCYHSPHRHKNDLH